MDDSFNESEKERQPLMLNNNCAYDGTESSFQVCLLADAEISTFITIISIVISLATFALGVLINHRIHNQTKRLQEVALRSSIGVGMISEISSMSEAAQNFWMKQGSISRADFYIFEWRYMVFCFNSSIMVQSADRKNAEYKEILKCLNGFYNKCVGDGNSANVIKRMPLSPSDMEVQEISNASRKAIRAVQVWMEN